MLAAVIAIRDVVDLPRFLPKPAGVPGSVTPVPPEWRLDVLPIPASSPTAVHVEKRPLSECAPRCVRNEATGRHRRTITGRVGPRRRTVITEA